MEKLNIAEQEVLEIGIRNRCLREFLLKNHGEVVQTANGIKKVKHLMISTEGPEAELDDMKRAGFSEERIAKTFSQWVGFHGASTKYLFEDIAQMSELRSIIISDMDFSETPECIADLSKTKSWRRCQSAIARDCRASCCQPQSKMYISPLMMRNKLFHLKIWKIRGVGKFVNRT